jgi:hypothetical protein
MSGNLKLQVTYGVVYGIIPLINAHQPTTSSHIQQIQCGDWCWLMCCQYLCILNSLALLENSIVN